MKAAVFNEPRSIIIKDITTPAIGDDQVLIKLEGCGICGSNMPVWEGREWFNYPFNPGQPGHEGWGVVTETGRNVKSVKIGDRVAALSYNAFAEYDVAREDEIVKLSNDLSSIPFPGEPLGCVMNIFKRSNIKPGDIVAVVGIGFLGSLLTQLSHNAGAKVIAISKREYSLDVAKKLGADYTIPMDENWKVIDKVKEITNEELCDKVIEAVGLQGPLDIASELTKVRGNLIIAGYHQDGMRQVNMQLWNWRGIDVINAHERDENVYINGIRDAAEAIKNKQLNPSILYTHKFSIDNINDAFNTMHQRPDGFVKALITYN